MKLKHYFWLIEQKFGAEVKHIQQEEKARNIFV